ncbi:MAG TPA: GNAT family N-acetyltransferase [Stellaceae bacterium]|nr:GNAT family N-acetyltransferase [Stellaceae bacterium]
MTMNGATDFRLRDATPDDMEAVARIYGHYVEATVYTFEEVPPTADEMRGRLRQLRQSGLPWRVAEASHGAVIGYAYAGPFRARSAYRYTLENSVYIAQDQARRGVGLALMRDVIRLSAAAGYRQMMAVIGDSANEASIRLHTRLGFRMIGHEAAVGLKFGRWVDVVQMQLALGDGERTVPADDPVGYLRR